MKRLLPFVFILCGVAAAAQKSGFSFKDSSDGKALELLYNGNLITAYCWYDSVKKPVLFPINTLDGISVTRGFPLAPRPGERTDHPHHVGMWMNYESVNGLDFWNHSTAIPFDKRGAYGTILHQTVSKIRAAGNAASFTATAAWVRPDGVVLLNETTTYNFTADKNRLLIDRTTTLTARDTTVVFKDVKDGFFAIRVARELELPSQQADVFVDARGNKTTVAAVRNNDVTGNYFGSTGLQGDSVWSSKGPWVVLRGKISDEPVSIGMMDHPKNVGYPAYWHARGYGLFALNPLGRAVFSNGKDSLHFALAPQQSVTFRYRVVVGSKTVVTNAEMKTFAAQFAQKQ